jgi:queuine/archaeosine tRNA-ribosyltransferase
MLLSRLLSVHNLHLYGELMRHARRAIEEGAYRDWAQRALAGDDALTDLA